MDADGVLAHFVGWVRSGTVAPQGASALAECRPTHGVRRPRRFQALGAASSIVRRPTISRNLSLCRSVALSLCRAGTGYGAAPHAKPRPSGHQRSDAGELVGWSRPGYWRPGLPARGLESGFLVPC